MSEWDLRDHISKGTASLFSGEKATLAASLNELATKNWMDSGWVNEQAAVVVQTIQNEFDTVNPLAYALNVRSVGEFDVAHRKTLPKGLQVFSVARGGYIDESKVEWGRYRLSKDYWGWHLTYGEDDAVTDWAETLAALQALARRKMQIEVLTRQYGLLDAAVTNASPYFVDGTGGLSKPMIDDAINAVFDAPRESGPLTVNSSIKIIGRASAVSKLADLDGWQPSEQDLNQVQSSGFLGQYRGCPVTRLPNYTDADDTSYFPEDELWVVSPDAGDFVFYGGIKPYGWFEPARRRGHIEARQAGGGYIYQPQVVRRIGNLND